ncbi:MAG: bifunctional serine/threonine-protein kinase/formylglycine-generating enzyme family protein [Planctomycetia bacterium]|nr:bifunctional serine/threonine-protein kinase/formylglycine-generating enzyme family protein [Planctomycetia bacterium]
MSDDSKQNLSLNSLDTFGNYENSDYEMDAELQELVSGMILAEKYRLENQAGQGGMGVVWKAFDVVGERNVALKFVPKEIRHNEAAMYQVKETFKTIQALNHQYICPVYALERDAKFGYYIVMMWLKGMTLAEFRKQKNFRQEMILPILKPLAVALDYAHKQGVIHRDVKPGNIFLPKSDNGTIRSVQLIDFGLAAEIQVSMTLHTTSQVKTSGTMAYMPPEQWRGRTQDARTDQYALATVAYELYSGHLPFMAANTEMLRLCVLQDPPDEIKSVPAHVNSALQKALAKDRKERFASCTDFVNALSEQAATPVLRTESFPEKSLEDFLPEEESHFWELASEYEELLKDYAPEGRRPTAKMEEMQAQANRIAEFCQQLLTQKERTRREYVEDGMLQTAAPMKTICDEIKRLNELVTKWRPKDFLQFIRTERRLSKDPKPGDRMVKTINGVQFAFRWCPAGSFMMGSPEDELGRYKDEKQHHVTLTKGFWMLETQVTQEMWQSVMGNNPSDFEGDDLPVENVSWHDCQKFCQKLRNLGLNIQLPTEAQWEYACRAGTTTSLNNGKNITSTYEICENLDEVGWYAKNSDWTTRAVGQKKPNAWGLYDMHGNVWEWCADWYGDYPSGSVTDPTGPRSGSGRVYRGGGWYYYARFCRSAYRGSGTPTDRGDDLGFRPVFVP